MSFIAAHHTAAAAVLFALPDGTGQIAYAQHLCAHVDPDVPVCPLPWPEVMPASMDALAAHMVDLMRSVRAHGPYRLLGYGPGGLLAYAVAQLLAEMDEPVDFVGLLHCHNPTIPPLTQPQEERSEMAAAQSGVSALSASCVRMAAYQAMWPAYLAQPLPAPLKLHLFYATGEAEAPHHLGWDLLMRREQVAVVSVPGTQSSMMEPTHIAQLGRAVSEALRDARGGDHRGHAPALALQGGASVPIVCVPGAGDSITSFVELGIALGKDQPLIGMQPRGVDGFRLPYGSVEAAAAAYLAAMSSHVPPGARVHLLGHSFGGWVVFEMARHLTAQGAKVASLTLVDTEAPDTVPGMRDETRDTIVARFLEALALRTPTPLPIDASALRGLNAQALIEALHRLMVDLKLMPARSKPDTLRGPFYSFARACRTRYCPGTPYDGPVNLVLVRDTRLDIDADAKQRHDTEQRWRAHAPALKVWHGPGNHMTILSPPNVGKLADWWRSMRPESPKDVLASSMVHLAPLIK